MMIKLCFAGKMRSGKDTAAETICAAENAEIVKLAQPLYDIMYFAQAVAGLEPTKDRKLLQWLGTEWGRAIDENIWVNSFIRRLNQAHIPRDIYICTDARFDNELLALKEDGFKLILVNRPESARIESGATNLDHPSEHGITRFDLFDYTIDNNSSLEEFKKKVMEILIEIKT